MFLTLNESEESAANEPVSNETKVKISITGLAYCELDPNKTTINFLRNINNHQLSMIVIGVERATGNVTFKKTFVIAKNHAVSIQAQNSQTPARVKTGGDLPLELIVNLQDVHSNTLKSKTPPAGVTLTSVLEISDCAFYTNKSLRSEFSLVDNTGAPAPLQEIGGEMGGNIICSDPDSVVTIKSPSLPGGELELPGINGAEEVVYSITFNNHCTNEEQCKAQVPIGGNDFSFYYDVLEEDGNPLRQFSLVPPFPIEGGNIFSDNIGTTDINTISPAVVFSDLAACNPVITDPPSSSY